MNTQITPEKRAALLGAVFGVLFIAALIPFGGRVDLAAHPVGVILGLPSVLTAFLMYPFGASMVLGPLVTEWLYFVAMFVINATSYSLVFWLVYKGYEKVKN